MAFKRLTSGAGGDLDNVTDNFGLDDDTVYVAPDIFPYTYMIFTLGGMDTIDLRDANPGNQHLIFAGSGNDTVLGGNSADFFIDHAGNDLATLGGGNDSVQAGAGKDTLSGGSGSDTILFDRFHVGERDSYNANTAGITCDLALTGAQDLGIFGMDRISGFENITGSNGNDRLSGDAAGNILIGQFGNDRLAGRGGADRLTGHEGSDTMIGGAGADTFDLTMSPSARDIVKYLSIRDSGTGLGTLAVDRISAFDAGGTAADDRIDLSAIDARPGTAKNDAFIFRGTGAFQSAAGEVRIVTLGADCVVQVDIDGDGASEMNILVLGLTGLTAADFIL